MPQEALAQDGAILRKGELRHSAEDFSLSGKGEERCKEREQEDGRG